MKPVTDPALLEQLNQGTSRKPVTDPNLLKQLNGEQYQQAQQPEKELSYEERLEQRWRPYKEKQDAKTSLLDQAKQAIKGNAEFEDAGSFESWQWTQPKFGFNEKNIKTTLAGMFGTDQDKFNSFIKNNPDIQVKLDKNKNPYFEDKGKKYYLDMPGLDLGDIADFGGEAGLYAASGNLAGIGKAGGAIKNASKMGLSQGAANVAAQNLAGRENVDVGEASLATLGGAAFDLVGSGINKLRNAKAGKTGLSPDKQVAIDFADAEKLPLYYDDVAENALGRTAGQQIDQIPIIGGAKTRRIQNQAQKKAAENFTKKFELPDSQMDDLHQIVKGGAQKHLERSKEIASKKYTVVEKELDKLGNFQVPAIKQKAQEIIEQELTKGSSANQSIITAMQNYMDIPDGNFTHWKNIRSDLTTLTRDLDNSLAGKNTALKGALKQVNKELNSAMDDVANNAGGTVRQKWRDANTFYQNAVTRYKKGALKNVMKDDDPEKMLNILMRKGGADATDSTYKSNQLFNSLDKDGKAAVRHGMMQKAFSEAMDGGDFSPAKYATMLENYSNRLGVVLSKQDKKYVDGLTKYMRVTQAAGNYGKNTPTGQMTVPILYTAAAAGAGTVSQPAAIAGGLGVIAIKKLFRTKKGRSFMLAMSNVPEGKKPPNELLQSIARYLTVKEVSE